SRAIQNYYEALQGYSDQQVTHETALRSAFQTLLADTAKLYGLALVPELSMKVGNRTIKPDATVRDDFRFPRGYWEAKDTDDDLDDEIRKKRSAGYPLNNTIFEDTREAVLYQSGKPARYDLTDRRNLVDLLNDFFTYVEPPIASFHEAVAEFGDRVDEVGKGLD